MSLHVLLCTPCLVLSCRNVPPVLPHTIVTCSHCAANMFGENKRQAREMVDICCTYAKHLSAFVGHFHCVCVCICATCVRHTCNTCRKISLSFSLPYVTYGISCVKHISNICQDMKQEMRNICNKCWRKCWSTCNTCPNTCKIFFRHIFW